MGQLLGIKHWVTVILMPPAGDREGVVALWDPYCYDSTQSPHYTRMLRRLRVDAEEHDYAVEDWSFRVQWDGYQCGVWATAAGLAVQSWCVLGGEEKNGPLKQDFVRSFAAGIAPCHSGGDVAAVQQMLESGDAEACKEACNIYVANVRRWHNVCIKAAKRGLVPICSAGSVSPLFQDERSTPAEGGDGVADEGGDEQDDEVDVDLLLEQHVDEATVDVAKGDQVTLALRVRREKERAQARHEAEVDARADGVSATVSIPDTVGSGQSGRKRISKVHLL